MTIKERVLAAMKTSYAKYGFKKEELNSLTDIISANLTDETTDEQITAALIASEGYAKMMQTVYNRGISETNKKYEGYIPKPVEQVIDTKTVTPPSNGGSLTVEKVQELIAKATENRQKEIDEAVAKATAPFLQAQEKARLNSLLQNHDKLKAIPEVFRNKYHLDKEENLDTLVSQIETDWTSLTQGLVASGDFVQAPSQASAETETDDFVTMMEDYGKRNAPAAEGSK